MNHKMWAKWKDFRLDEDEKLTEGPDAELIRSLNYISNDIFRVMTKYQGKADVDKAVHSWLLGLKAKIKKWR